MDSPVGDESKNRVEYEWGTPKNSDVGHLYIADRFDLLDFQSGSKITGNKFVFLKNQAALLELALINYAVQLVSKRGDFKPVLTPDIAR